MQSIILFLLMSGVAVAHPEKPARKVQTGVASWYGYECSKTASGERYDPKSLTAAHRTLPFGTMVRVKNLSCGKSVTLRINNRGPYCKGRVIDVSKSAAQQLDMIKSGTAKVEVAVLQIDSGQPSLSGARLLKVERCQQHADGIEMASLCPTRTSISSFI